MSASDWTLYEPMLERDVARIRAEAAVLSAREGINALFSSVARFSVLAYAPSQHARHAFLACAAVDDLRTFFAERFRDAVVECAIYAATSRQPWSEPPIVEQPDAEKGRTISVDDALAAVASRDLPLLERWLSANLDRHDLGACFFTVAAADDGDMGHKLIVANAAWRLAQRFPRAVRFTALRVALVEWCGHAGASYAGHFDGDRAALLERLTSDFEHGEDAVAAAHAIHLFDAALLAEREGASAGVVASILGSLRVERARRDARRDAEGDEPPLPVYSYARDLAGYLEANAIANRITPAFGSDIGARIRAAAWRNLMHGESFEEWSFA